MIEYLVCGIFEIAYITILFSFGTVIIKEKENQSLSFMAGYFCYSFIIAIGGMVVQLLNVPWIYFAVYLAVVFIGIIIIILYHRVKTDISLWRDVLYYLKTNWFLFFLCAFLCFVLFFYYRSFWYGNHLDDGYYLTKVATLPYELSGYYTNYSVGIEQKAALSYLLNTWELEASVFVKVLNVTPTLFLRMFQSGFNYFVFFNCVLAFGKQILKALDKQLLDSIVQYVLGVFVLFFVYYVYLMDTKILFLRDMFHLNTAMYYGSSLAKLIVIIGMLLFFVQDSQISIKMVLGVACISVLMISKSSVVLPIIVIVIIASSIVLLLMDENKKKKVLGVIITALVIVGGIIIPGNNDAQKEVYSYVTLSLKSPIVIMCIIIFIISFFAKEKMIYKLNAILFIIGIFITIPELNDIFEFCSVYDFVAGRAWSTYIYTFIIVSVIYLYVLLAKYMHAKSIKYLFVGFTGVMFFLVVYGYKTDGKELFVTDDMPANTNLIEDIKVLYHNNKFIPNSTIALGESLQNLGDITGVKLYVLSPQWASIDGTYHSLATQIRTFAPDIVSVSASERYGVSEDSFLYGYDQSKYDNFIENPIEKNMNELKEEVEQYGINCIIVQNEECAKQLIEMGFEQVDEIQNGVYYVWYKKSE